MRYLLWPLAQLFLLIAGIRVWLYQQGLLKSKKVSRPVLCVGNLTTGGTGKTPWVQWTTQLFQNNGKKVAILSRGYGGDFDGVLEVTDNMDPRKCGDEPLWLKRTTQADVYVCRSRYQAAVQVLEEKKPDLLILDDGFQHLKLQRDFNLVILDASAPAWHYDGLPMGRLRETFRALKRADALIFNKCNYANKEALQSILEKSSPYINEDRIYYADYAFAGWLPLVDNLSREMNKNQVTASCGVGNPHGFIKTIEDQGISVIKKFIYPDHHFWKPNDIEKMAYHMKQMGSSDLIITEKDAVKLVRYRKHFYEMGMQMWVCSMHLEIRSHEDRLKKQLIDKLGVQ